MFQEIDGYFEFPATVLFTFSFLGGHWQVGPTEGGDLRALQGVQTQKGLTQGDRDG